MQLKLIIMQGSVSTLHLSRVLFLTLAITATTTIELLLRYRWEVYIRATCRVISDCGTLVSKRESYALLRRYTGVCVFVQARLVLLCANLLLHCWKQMQGVWLSSSHAFNHFVLFFVFEQTFRDGKLFGTKFFLEIKLWEIDIGWL